MQVTEQTIPDGLKPYKFTPETARLAALKSHEPTSARYVRPVEIETEAQQADLWRRERLALVRAQLARLAKMSASEDDPNKLDRLASAEAKWAEQERQLAGRPMPGSLKPRTEPAKRRGESNPSPVEPNE